MKYFLLALMLLAPVAAVSAATPKTAPTSRGGLRFSDVQLKTGVRLRYAENKGIPGVSRSYCCMAIRIHGFRIAAFCR
jgi:hypothetical protein